MLYILFPLTSSYIHCSVLFAYTAVLTG